MKNDDNLLELILGLIVNVIILIVAGSFAIYTIVSLFK